MLEPWRMWSSPSLPSLRGPLCPEVVEPDRIKSMGQIERFESANKWLIRNRTLNTVYTRMLRAILNKSWQQHPTRHQLYGHLPPITKTIQVRRTRHAGHCWRSRDELIRDVLLWIPTHGRAKAGRPARTYIQQLCEDTGCCPEDLPRAMNDREEWRERVRDIRAASTIWWWWWNSVSLIFDWTIRYGLVWFGFFVLMAYQLLLVI